MTLEEANEILANTSGWVGDYRIHQWMIEQGGVEHTAHMTLDGGFTLLELEAVIVYMKAEIEKATK